MSFWTDIAICFLFLQNVQYILPRMIRTMALSTSLFRLVDYCLLYDFVLGIFSIAVFAFIYLITKSIFSRSN